MGGWSHFLDAFFKWTVIERYFPAIMKGVVVTIEIAAAVVVTGILLGLVLAISAAVLPAMAHDEGEWNDAASKELKAAATQMFVEMDKASGWFQIWHGSEIDPNRVTVL